MKSYLFINPYLLRKIGITGIEFLYLYYLDTGEAHGINFREAYMSKNKLLRLKFIKIKENGKIKARKKAKDLIKTSLVRHAMANKEKELQKEDPEFDTFVLEFRSKWLGLKPGSMGGKLSCTAKLKKWMTINPTYTKEQILAAATRYLDTEGRNTNYLQRADYFIYKRDKNGDDLSRLDSYIEEIAMDVDKNQDWTSELN